jgi:hypothetical protein
MCLFLGFNKNSTQQNVLSQNSVHMQEQFAQYGPGVTVQGKDSATSHERKNGQSKSKSNQVVHRRYKYNGFLDPRDFHHYSPLEEIVRGIRPNNTTVNRTNEKEKGEEEDGQPVVDVMSTGSQTRLDFLDGQVNSWASHSYVRHFWGFSELDDVDPNCSATIGKTNDHFRMCKRVIPKKSDSVLMKYFQMAYGGGTRSKPGGWHCAQTRFGQALGRVGAEYRKRIRQYYDDENHPPGSLSAISSILPDYLFLVDDDTYVNVEIIANQIKSELAGVTTTNNNNQNIMMVPTTTPTTMYPRAYAGCASFDSRVNITVPIGGFAVFLTRGSVLRLITPIFCNRTTTTTNTDDDDDDDHLLGELEKELRHFQSQVCQRLQQNILLERDRFVEGMTLSDLSYELSKSAPDFCLNSDWLYAYFINYYYLSDPIPSHMNSSDGFLLHPFRDSYAWGRTTKGACLLNTVELCTASNETPHVCHYQTPESMMAIMAKK